MTTLYMVELELSDRSLLAEWSDWYTEHLARLLSVPGFLSAQRFVAETRETSPFLAVYELAGPTVLDSRAYKERGGPTSPGKWTAVMTNWHRNLFDGRAAYRSAQSGAQIAVIDILPGEARPPSEPGFDWWPAIALDRTVSERGIAALKDGDVLPPIAGAPALRIYRAITPRLTASST